jgi:hypothetical protein
MNDFVLTPIEYLGRWSINISDRIAMLYDGRIRTSGTVDESLVEELNLLMEDLRANPQKYVRLSNF